MKAAVWVAVCLTAVAAVVAQAPPPAVPTPEGVMPTPAGVRCPNDCNDNGVCEQGKCMCLVGYAGDDCSVALPCPHDCNGHGECRSSVCFCFPGYAGQDCSEITADLGLLVRELVADSIREYYQECLFHDPNSDTLDSYVNSVMSESETLISVRDKICTPIPCPNDCNGHGTCFAGRCTCFPGWVGDDCSATPGTCPHECSHHGQCTYMGTCLCDRQWTGPDCSIRSCPGDCSQHGVCINGTCQCAPGYSGVDCGTSANGTSGTQGVKCPGRCTGHGTCNARGVCECEYGFGGMDCSQTMLYTVDLSQDSAIVWSPATMFPSQGMTVEMWAKCANCGPSPTLLSYGQGSQSNVFSIVNLADLRVAVLDQFTPGSGINLKDGRWHHVAVTWNSVDGRVMIYVDGRERLSNPLTRTRGKSLPSSGSLAVGQQQLLPRSTFDPQQYFGGEVTDIRIWNHPLSGREIATRFKTALQATEKGLLAYWRLEKDPQKRNGVLDATHNRNNAKVVGSPRFTGDHPPLQVGTTNEPLSTR